MFILVNVTHYLNRRLWTENLEFELHDVHNSMQHFLSYLPVNRPGF
jgi:hypothetical protein